MKEGTIGHIGSDKSGLTAVVQKVMDRDQATVYALELANMLTHFQMKAGVPIPPELERVEIMRTILGWMGQPQPQQPERGKMSYADLVKYAHGHGKTERDVLRYFAYVQAHYVLEQTTEELIEGILEGSFTLSVEDIAADWEEHDVDEQDAIIPLMLDWWNGGNPATLNE